MISSTIIVCTHNRETIVARAVEAALHQAAAVGGDVIVVNNASTDGTAEVLEALRARSAGRLEVLLEPIVGLSAARNRGLEQARGEVAVFLDDDAVPRPGWLAALLAPFTRASVACTGGRIVAQFPGPAPAWFSPALAPAVSGFDLGDSPRRLRYGRPGDVYPYGANIAFRASDVDLVGGFSTAVGLKGRQLFAHEETDLCYRLEEIGREIVYAPAAVVDHHVGAERLTPDWFLERHRAGGYSAAIFVLRNRGALRAISRLRWLYGRALLPRARRRARRSEAPLDARRFAEECHRREARGYLAGLASGLSRRRALRGDPQPPAVARIGGVAQGGDSQDGAGGGTGRSGRSGERERDGAAVSLSAPASGSPPDDRGNDRRAT
jgi:GT2 family glycosyltransferase